MHVISCQDWFDLNPHAGERELVDVQIGFDGATYVLLADRPTEYRDEKGIFARVRPKRRQSYVVLVITEDGSHRVIPIPPQDMNFHYVQPMPDGNLLLVCARSYFRGMRDFDRNARLVSPDGRAVSDFLLGDGIQDVQTDATGVIWTSYFDEGIFGNYGWKSPVGAAGLVAWDTSGTMLYEF